MKYLPLALLLALIVGASFAMLQSHRENVVLSAKISELNQTINSYQCVVDSRDESLAHCRLGTVVLYRMALSGDDADLFDFLDAIPVESLNCKVLDLPEHPTMKLLWYSQNPESVDGTRVPMEQVKTVLAVINSDTFDVVDHLMLKRYAGVSVGMNRPYQLDGKLSDGTPVEYWIKPTGFERRH
ncbi:hypothetical protein [Novipirellula sp.]|uniref:hypothetical protein n=1 Tax=Novipirellula sp. TaxID=2795430 RepID=UPI003562CE71